MKFNGVCLITRNVAVLSRFYMQVLGVSGEGDDRHMELKTEGAGIAIFSYDGMEEMAPGSMSGAGFGGFTLTFGVENVDAEYERIRAMGACIVKPPQTHPWGSRSFWFRDPDGNIVNFAGKVRV